MVTPATGSRFLRRNAGVMSALALWTLTIQASDTAADPDTEAALHNAASSVTTNAAARSFENAVTKRSDTALPDTRGLLDWLRSQTSTPPDLDSLLKGAKHLREPSVNDAGYDSQVYVFVSFSMPELALRNLYRAASPKGIPLVLRGFVTDESGTTAGLMATRDRLFEVFGDDLATGAGVLIDPTLFERFEISQVPAFVATEHKPVRCDEIGCATPNNWQLFGDVTLEFALERLERHVPAIATVLEDPS